MQPIELFKLVLGDHFLIRQMEKESQEKIANRLFTNFDKGMVEMAREMDTCDKCINAMHKGGFPSEIIREHFEVHREDGKL